MLSSGRGLALILNVSIAILIIAYGGTPNNYFVASPLSISNRIVVNGHIPERLYTGSGFWHDHANSFTNYPGSAIIISTLSIVGAIDYYAFAYLPICSIFWVLVLMCFVRLFSGRDSYVYLLVSLLLTVYTVSLRPEVWTLSYHSLGFFSHMLIVYLITKYSLTNGCDRRKYVLAIVLVGRPRQTAEAYLK
jgi:hypothetical protein